MSDAITWIPGVDRFDANPAATVALDRAAWERLGATFVESDDGDDETPGLAMGQIATERGPLDFAVLDYGEGTTFLLVPGRDRAALDAVHALLTALHEARAINLATDLVDLSAARPYLADISVEQRVIELENRLTTREAHESDVLTGLVANASLALYPALAPWVLREAVAYLGQRSLEESGQLSLELNEEQRRFAALSSLAHARLASRNIFGSDLLICSPGEDPADEPVGVRPLLRLRGHEDEDS